MTKSKQMNDDKHILSEAIDRILKCISYTNQD